MLRNWFSWFRWVQEIDTVPNYYYSPEQELAWLLAFSTKQGDYYNWWSGDISCHSQSQIFSVSDPGMEGSRMYVQGIIFNLKWGRQGLVRSWLSEMRKKNNIMGKEELGWGRLKNGGNENFITLECCGTIQICSQMFCWKLRKVLRLKDKEEDGSNYLLNN